MKDYTLAPKILISVAFVSVLALVAASHCRGPTPINVSNIACEVYRSLYQQLPEKVAVWFVPTTNVYTGTGHPDEIDLLPPIAFKKEEIDEFGHMDYFDGDKVIQMPPVIQFSEDTSTYFFPTTTGPSVNIEHCFEGVAERPGFYSGNFQRLYAQEKLAARDSDGFVTLIQLSPVGVSRDGRQALVFVDMTCGGLCGSGSFSLFQKDRSDVWQYKGYSWRWVS